MAQGGGSWRDIARPVIARVLRETAGQSEQEIRRALRVAYPFFERRMWPYKVWLDEIKIQRGLKRASFQAKANRPPDPRQIGFDYGDNQKS